MVIFFAWNAWINMNIFDMQSVLVNQFELEVEVTQGLVCLYNDQLAMIILRKIDATLVFGFMTL